MSRIKIARACAVVLSVLMLYLSTYAMKDMVSEALWYVPGDSVGSKLLHVGVVVALGHYAYQQLRPNGTREEVQSLLKSMQAKLDKLNDLVCVGNPPHEASLVARVAVLQDARRAMTDRIDALFGGTKKGGAASPAGNMHIQQTIEHDKKIQNIYEIIVDLQEKLDVLND